MRLSVPSSWNIRCSPAMNSILPRCCRPVPSVRATRSCFALRSATMYVASVSNSLQRTSRQRSHSEVERLT